MSSLTNEKLFLLEFMVVDIKLDTKYEAGTPPGELCVSFQFLDNVPVNVCQGDFDLNGKCRKNQKNVKNGKSCLFSLTPDQIQNALESFNISITILKKMQSGWDPDQCDVGEALVPFEAIFKDIIENFEMSTIEAPKAQTLKNKYEILDNVITPIGEIEVYVRLTCLGKSVVTQFQMNLEDKSIFFKNKDGSPYCKYKNTNDKGRNSFQQDGSDKYCGNVCSDGEDVEQTDANCSNSWQPHNVTNTNNDKSRSPNCPTICCFEMNDTNTRVDDRVYQDSRVDDSNCANTECITNGNNGNILGMAQYPFFPNQPMGNQMNKITPCIECEILPNAPCLPNFAPGMTPCIECGTFPNAPCLPVAPNFIPTSTPPVSEATQCGSTESLMPEPADIPGNYEIIETTMGPNRLIIRMHKDRKKLEKINSSDDCCCTADCFNEEKKPEKPQTDKYNKTVAANSPFTIKMGGGRGPSDRVAVKPPVYKKPDGTVMTEISDPDRDLYVLRIGKKSTRKEKKKKKNKFDLEFCTPRLSRDHRGNHE